VRKIFTVIILTLSLNTNVFALGDIAEPIVKGAVEILIPAIGDTLFKNSKGFTLFGSDEEAKTKEAQGAAAEAIKLQKEKEAQLEAKRLKDPTYQLMLKDIETVKQNPSHIQNVVNPDERIQLAAVEVDGNAIQFIENPSKKVQFSAVKQSPSAYQYIKNPYKRVTRYYERNKI